MVGRTRARCAGCRRTSVLPKLENRGKIFVAAVSPRTVARCGCVACAAVGAKVAERTDPPVAPAVVRDHLLSHHVVADRLATRSRADGRAGFYVRACRFVDGAF